MKLTNRQKSLIWKSLNLNEEFFDDNPDMNMEEIIEEKQLKDCNYSFGVYPPMKNIYTKIIKLIADMNNHISINQNGENIFDNLVLWKYDPKFNSFKFGFDSIKEDKREDATDTFKYIINYLLGQFGTFDVVLGKPNKHMIITTMKISIQDKNTSSINSLLSLLKRIAFNRS